MTNEELCEQIQQGIDVQKNLAELYEQNKRLIWKWVHPCARHRGADMDDLMQEAFFGIRTAAMRFDLSQNYKFTTYAMLWVKNVVQHYLDTTGRIRRIPSHLERDERRVKTFIARYAADHGGCDPDDKDILTALNMKEGRLKTIKDVMREEFTVSLDTPIDGKEDCSIAESVPDPDDHIQDLLDDEQEKQDSMILWKAVDRLSDKQADVIRKYFQQGMSVGAIASEMNVSHQAASKHLHTGLKKLQKNAALQIMAKDRLMTSSAAFKDSAGKFSRSGSSQVEKIAVENVSMMESYIRLHQQIEEMKQMQET